MLVCRLGTSGSLRIRRRIVDQVGGLLQGKGPVVGHALHDEGRAESPDAGEAREGFVVEGLEGGEVAGDDPQEGVGSPNRR